MAQPSAAFSSAREQAFRAMHIGQRYSYRRSFSEADLSLFCGLTGDLSPFHLDETFSSEGPFGKRILPGLLPASMVTHIGGLLGFLAAEMHFEFLSAVCIGDTVTCVVTVTAKDEARKRLHCTAELCNQHGKLVIRATFSGFPTQMRLQPDAD